VVAALCGVQLFSRNREKSKSTRARPAEHDRHFNFQFSLSDFHAGVHIRVPIRESPIVPYFVAGFGGLTQFQRTAALSYTGADGAQHTISGTDPGGTDFAVNFGGGIRYYLNQRFGFRLEAKGYKPNGSITPVFGKVEAGFFYQLR
jgi:hypothetical protein